MRLIVDYLLPPSGPIMLSILAYWICRHQAKPSARHLLTLALAMLYGLSLPLTAALLARSLQTYAPLATAELTALSSHDSAIVVLAGGLHLSAPEYQGETVHTRTLGRLRYAAHLAKLSQLPILLSGGLNNPHEKRPSMPREADLMAEILSNEFGLSPSWVENQSQNTQENALFSARLLQQAGIKRVVLVTQAMHMRRAVEALQQQGFEVLPAPTLFANQRLDMHVLRSWLPSVTAIADIHYACHEWLGIWYYRFQR